MHLHVKYSPTLTSTTQQTSSWLTFTSKHSKSVVRKHSAVTTSSHQTFSSSVVFRVSNHQCMQLATEKVLLLLSNQRYLLLVLTVWTILTMDELIWTFMGLYVHYDIANEPFQNNSCIRCDVTWHPTPDYLATTFATARAQSTGTRFNRQQPQRAAGRETFQPSNTAFEVTWSSRNRWKHPQTIAPSRNRTCIAPKKRTQNRSLTWVCKM